MNKNIVLSYICFLVFVVIFSYLFVDRNFIYLNFIYTGFSTSYRTVTSMAFGIVTTIFYLFYFYILRLSFKNKLTFISVRRLILISIITLLFSYPAMLSYDIFNYTTTSKVLFFYQENPYVVMPIEFPTEQFLLYTRATNKIALYGPMWLVLSIIPYIFGLGNVLFTLFTFKIFTSFFFLGSAYLIWKITKNVFALTLFALNPLMLIEVCVSGHNDSVMIFFALLSFYLLQKERRGVSFVSLLLSILVKYVTVVLALLWGLSVIHKTMKGKNIYYYAALLLSVVFFIISPIREEMYPWYFLWVFSFVAVNYEKVYIVLTSIVLSISLLLGYMPYLATGNYFGSTPILREILVFIPPLLTASGLVIHKTLFKKRP